MNIFDVNKMLADKTKHSPAMIHEILTALIHVDSAYSLKDKDDASPICALLKESIEIQERKLSIIGQVKQ